VSAIGRPGNIDAALSVVAFLVAPVAAQSVEPIGLIGASGGCHDADLAAPLLKRHDAEYIILAEHSTRGGLESISFPTAQSTRFTWLYVWRLSRNTIPGAN
jgi:hypothetical protein